MRVLAIDPGTNCGWASIRRGFVESGVQRFDLRRGESPGMRFLRFNVWLGDCINYSESELITYELAHHRGGAATEVLVGMTTRIQEYAARERIEHVGVHTGTLKKWATGKGNASKEEMCHAATDRYGRVVEDDNEADALLMLAWAQEQFSEEACK